MAWTTFVNSTTADANQVNANFAYAQGDLVPHSQGVLADNQFKLGTYTARWGGLSAISINASNLILTGTATLIGNLALDTSTAMLVFNTAGAGMRGQIAASVNALYINSQDFIQINPNSVMAAKFESGGTTTVLVTSIFRQNLFIDTSTAMVAFNTSGAGSRGRIAASVNSLYLSSEDSIQLSPNSVVSMLFNSSGNASVKHQNPSQTLDVLGTVFVKDTASINHATLISGTRMLVAGILTTTTEVYVNLQAGISATAGITFGSPSDDDVGYIRFNNGSTQLQLVNSGKSIAWNASGLLSVNHINPSQTVDIKGNLAVASDTTILGHLSVTGKIGIGSNILSGGELDAGGQPEACIFNNTQTTIQISTTTFSAWSEAYDTHNMFTSTLPARLYAPTSGTYLITVGIYGGYSTTATYSRFSLGYFDSVASSSILLAESHKFLGLTESEDKTTLVTAKRMNAGDYITLEAYSNDKGILFVGSEKTANRIAMQKLF